METKTGTFDIPFDRKVFGELKIAGLDSSIVLRHGEFIWPSDATKLSMRGTLFDLTKITLIDCLMLSSQERNHIPEGERTHSTTLFPHFIVEGRTHLAPDGPSVQKVHFTFEDVFHLCNDFNAFRSVVDATPFIGAIVESESIALNRSIPIGPEPQIAYFTGGRLILEVDTAIGKVRIEHSPTWPTGGPRGVRIDNTIWFSISFDSPLTVPDAADRVLALLRFVTVAVGRAQEVPEFTVSVDDDVRVTPLTVHWSHHPRKKSGWSPRQRNVSSRDLPLDPIHRLDEFVSVLKCYFATDKDRCVARVRVNDAFTEQSSYSFDRIVGAANAFDLLSSPAVPEDAELTPEQLAAQKACKEIIKKLPDSDEKDSLYNALGWLGRASLKKKVRHRADIILRAPGGERFESLHFVCNCAVDLRNHFVHGSRIKFDRDGRNESIGFLTDTLEFVFLASELVEGGWDLKRFVENGTSMTHPFGDYYANYRNSLRRLDASVAKTD